jgi:hypothetical protein
MSIPWTEGLPFVPATAWTPDATGPSPQLIAGVALPAAAGPLTLSRWRRAMLDKVAAMIQVSDDPEAARALFLATLLDLDLYAPADRPDLEEALRRNPLLETAMRARGLLDGVPEGPNPGSGPEPTPEMLDELAGREATILDLTEALPWLTE